MKTIKSGPISAFGGANFVFDYLNKIKIDQPCTDCLPPMVNQSKYNWKDIFYSLKSVYLCGGDCIEDLQTNLKSHFLDNPFIKLAEPIQTCKTKRGAVTHQYCANTKLERLNIEILEGIGVFNPGILTVD